MKNITQVKELPASNNKITTDFLSVFRLMPESVGLPAHSNGDIVLEMPEKNKQYIDLVKTIAEFANEFMIERHQGVMCYFKSSGMLRASTGSYNYVFYDVYTNNLNAPDEVLRDVSNACKKQFSEKFEMDSDIQIDAFKPQEKTFDDIEMDVDFPKATSLRESFIKNNKSFNLTTPVSISSDFDQEPVKVTGTIKPPKSKTADERGKSYSAHYLYEGCIVSQKVIYAYEVLFNGKRGNRETFKIDNDQLFDRVVEGPPRNKFFKAKISVSKTTDSNQQSKYIKEFETWEGPKGQLI